MTRSRRQFIQLSVSALLAGAARGRATHAAPAPPRVFVPVARAAPALPTAGAPLVGPASGRAEQAIAWLAPRCAPAYTLYDVMAIVGCYRDLGEWAGMDWFLALAQLAHETGSLTSWWAQRPRRNPAGIGVTGRAQPGAPSASPGASWAWDERDWLWREGVSFPSWQNHAAPAHLGRLLAYALPDSAANDAQRQLIGYALLIRPLRADYRGVAPLLGGLDGRWAVPGDGYGERIAGLAQRMRA